MPCDSNVDMTHHYEFSNILCDIMVLSQTHNIDNLVIAGDLNTDLSRANSVHTQMIEEFMVNNCLKICSLGTIDYSYESKINGLRSHLDHFIVSENICDLVTNVSVRHDGDNLSDHSPVIAEIDCQVTHASSARKPHDYQKYKWKSLSESDRNLYHEKLNALLMGCSVPEELLTCKNLQCIDHYYEIQVLHDNIINCCLQASEHISASNNTYENSHRKKVVPGWNEYVAPYRDKALFWHHIWKENGSPRSGLLANIRNKSRLKYHYATRFVVCNRKTLSANNMAESLVNNNYRDLGVRCQRIKIQDLHIQIQLIMLLIQKILHDYLPKSRMNCTTVCLMIMQRLQNCIMKYVMISTAMVHPATNWSISV